MPNCFFIKTGSLQAPRLPLVEPLFASLTLIKYNGGANVRVDENDHWGLDRGTLGLTIDFSGGSYFYLSFQQGITIRIFEQTER